MKALAIAAIAFAGFALPTPPAQADASNCTAWNGPFCETAHNIRHHRWQTPIVWPQYPQYPRYPVYPTYPQGCFGGGYGGGYGAGFGGGYGSCYQPTYPTVGGCAIQSTWGCRQRVPVFGNWPY